MMKIGIFTPIHKIDIENLTFLFKSILKQERQPDIWLLVLNGKAINSINELRAIEHFHAVSSFIRVVQSDKVGSIGALKGEACDTLIELGMDLLVELDYDDYLRHDALAKLEEEARTNINAVFFYSNFAHFKFVQDGLVESDFYGAQWGWEKRKITDEEVFESAVLNEMIAFPARPQFLARIESSPNHLRAFRSLPYKKINGYDSTIKVGDDHDLMCRFFIEYGERGFSHLNECLYYQRTGETTTISRNKEIQDQVKKNYIKYVEALYKKWSNDNDYEMIDLGGRFNCPEHYTSVDLQDADYIIDLNKDWSNEKHGNIINDNSVGIIRAYHILEHLDDPIHFFNEAYRLLAPGGLLLIEVPSLNHPMAFADPTHKSFWSTLNFLYFTNEQKARYIRPQYKGAFLPVRVEEYSWEDGTLAVSAQLTALKGWYSKTWWGNKQTDESYIK